MMNVLEKAIKVTTHEKKRLEKELIAYKKLNQRLGGDNYFSQAEDPLLLVIDVESKWSTWRDSRMFSICFRATNSTIDRLKDTLAQKLSIEFEETQWFEAEYRYRALWGLDITIFLYC